MAGAEEAPEMPDDLSVKAVTRVIFSCSPNLVPDHVPVPPVGKVGPGLLLGEGLLAVLAEVFLLFVWRASPIVLVLHVVRNVKCYVQ